jgi:uncharacterized membrane protein YfcA
MNESLRILVYLALGLSIGGISGALGIGGGVILIPALMWLCGFDYAKATGTSLAILVPPIGLLAAWKSWTHGRVDVEAAIFIALAFAIGAYAGAAVVPYIHPNALKFIFGLLLLYVAMRFIIGSDSEAISAVAGLTAMAAAFLGHLGLRALGRRHLTAPQLGDHIRAARERRDATDYHI